MTDRTDPNDLPQRPIVTWKGIAPGRGRRTLDVIGACAALLVLAVPMLLLYLLVRTTSRGPGVFRQARLGQGGRPFRFYKFRTMRTGVGGLKVTADRDPRLTRVGGMLRRLSLDELPQLWNVLRGDMTLVGPRPETPDLAVHYPGNLRWVFDYRPGLTGPSEVRFRDFDVLAPGQEVDLRVYIERIVPARTAVDLLYLSDPSMRATLMAIVDTVRHLLGMEIPPLPGQRPAARPEPVTVPADPAAPGTPPMGTPSLGALATETRGPKAPSGPAAEPNAAG